MELSPRTVPRSLIPLSKVDWLTGEHGAPQLGFAPGGGRGGGRVRASGDGHTLSGARS